MTHGSADDRLRGVARRSDQVSTRRVETSAVTTLAPVVMIAPVSLAVLFLYWLVIRMFWDVAYTWFVTGYVATAALLFVRPLQVVVLARLLGARRPTHEESIRLDTAWRSVLQAAHLPRDRYAVAVLPSDELNAFASGGHLVVVTTYALDTLPRDELAGVLAHELAHHLGLHTVATTFAQWLAAPVHLLASAGYFLRNVATAATSAFARRSSALTAIGTAIAAVLLAVSWLLSSALLLVDSVAAVAGRGAEFQADVRAVRLGFGRELARALRRVAAEEQRASSDRLRRTTGHPSARSRIARIEAIVRAGRSGTGAPATT